MSELFKSRKKIGLILGCVFMALTLVSGTIAGILLGSSLETAPGEGEESSLAQILPEDEPAPEDEGELLPGEEPEPEAPVVPVYNVPSEMRGVYLVPGSDFLKDVGASDEVIQKEIDKALADAVNFTMNTVIVDTVYKDQVIFDSAATSRLGTGFDVMEYIVEGARDKGLHVYAIFDASRVEEQGASAVLALSTGTIGNLTLALRDFAETYQPDAILIDGYAAPVEEESVAYNTYLLSGGAVGFDNYLRQSPEAVVKTASRTLRAYAPNVQIGLLADSVWASDAEEEDGLPVQASYTALGSGNADTKAFVESGAVDFVAVKAYSSLTDQSEPFETVVSWWGDVARQSGVPMYVVHAADKAVTQNTGWTSGDQLTRQVIKASGVSGYQGSIFNSLNRLVANPSDATATLVKYYEGEVKSEHILTELAVTKPEKTTFTTQEPSVVFTGASDPNSPVTINDREITTDASGYFTLSMDLAGGENTFVIKHKDKAITYKITRNVEILKEIAPTGTISTDGNMEIQISALAYEDASVSAAINGSSVPMQIDDSAEDETARDSNYKRFVGYYTAPAGTSKEQNLGAITITASWQGVTKSLTGATVKVNKKAVLEDGVPVVVTADQAWTYPANTLDNVPSPNYYPIPKGAMDYAVGDEITYVKDKVTYKYYNLASGLRVLSSDIAPITTDYASGNAISGINITTEGRYTYLTVKTAQKVTYKIKYTGSEFAVTFHNTSKNPGGSQSLNQNPLFTKASWGSDTLTLTLAKSGGFLGFKGYYDNSGNLVFRFNTPPSGLSGARIAVDPGHGGGDTGALGFLAAYPERVINQAIAELLADELESRGATVLLIDNSGNPSLQNRVKQAEAFNADLFVSVHNNTATRASAIGTETYYFYPYAKNTASAVAAQVSSRLGSDNRGARQSYYHITLSAQVPSVLAECGFITNKAEYEKLIKTEYQQAIAVGIADGLAAGLQSAYTGVTTTGSQSMGSGATATSDSGNSTTGGSQLEELTFYLDEVQVNEGKEYTLKLLSYPEDADLSGVTFKSGNTSVATVSMGGKVTGVTVGSAKITASSADGKVTAVCQIEVVEKGGEQDEKVAPTAQTSTGTVPLKNVDDPEFMDDVITLTKNATYTLQVTSSKGLVKNSDFLWESDDTDVVTVDSSGNVKAKSTGYAEITAHTADDAHYLTCTVKVATGKIAVTGITLDNTSLFLKKGTTQQLYVTFKPATASNKSVSWTSSKTSVATVDENGLLTAKGSGKATITATSKDGKFKATCEVEVTTKTVKVEDIYLEHNEWDPQVGEICKLEYYFNPDPVTDPSVTWKSSNPSVASVDEQGNVTCHKVGSATITVTSVSNTKAKDTCEFNVYE